MKQALASDIDGTLFFHDHDPMIKREDIAAIKDYQQSGSLFGLCSGRPYCGVINLFEEEIKPDFYIISSGALILDSNQEVIYEQLIDFKAVKEIYHTYNDSCVVIIQSDDGKYVYKNKSEGFNDSFKVINDINELKGKIYGISLVFIDELTTKEQLEVINQKYPQLEGFQNLNSIDIVTKGCSKGNALKMIKKHYQLDYISGIGDSYNDITMLANADIAFTFNDSPALIKNMADYQVASVCQAITILKKDEKILAK